MASLIRKDGVIFETSDVAPSPSKDFWQILVTCDEVILRWWKISLRNDAKVAPGQIKQSHQDFLDDYKAHTDVQMNFGQNTLDYVMRLVKGQIDYLPRLSDQIIIHIVQYLPLDDISRLAQTSRKFHELCQSDGLWRSLYLGVSTKPRATDDALETLAKEVGWRKLYFTNKLQLQMQLRRQKNKKSPPLSPKQLVSPRHHGDSSHGDAAHHSSAAATEVVDHDQGHVHNK